MGEDKRELSSEEIEDLIKMFNDDFREAVEKEEERRKKAEIEIKEEKKGEGKIEKKEEKEQKSKRGEG